MYILFRYYFPRINHFLGGILFISNKESINTHKKSLRAGDERTSGSGPYPISGLQLEIRFEVNKQTVQEHAHLGALINEQYI